MFLRLAMADRQKVGNLRAGDLSLLAARALLSICRACFLTVPFFGIFVRGKFSQGLRTLRDRIQQAFSVYSSERTRAQGCKHV
jgi:hypothetical protein